MPLYRARLTVSSCFQSSCQAKTLTTAGMKKYLLHWAWKQKNKKIKNIPFKDVGDDCHLWYSQVCPYHCWRSLIWFYSLLSHRTRRRRACLGCEWPAGGALTKWSEFLAWWLVPMSTCQRWVMKSIKEFPRGLLLNTTAPQWFYSGIRKKKRQLLLIEADANDPDDVIMTHSPWQCSEVPQTCPSIMKCVTVHKGR